MKITKRQLRQIIKEESKVDRANDTAKAMKRNGKTNAKIRKFLEDENIDKYAISNIMKQVKYIEEELTKSQLKQFIREELSETARLEPQWVDAYVDKIYNLLVKANKEIIEDAELKTAHKQLAVLARSAKAEKGYEHHDIKAGTLEPVTLAPGSISPRGPFSTYGVDPEHLKEMIKEELESVLRETKE